MAAQSQPAITMSASTSLEPEPAPASKTNRLAPFKRASTINVASGSLQDLKSSRPSRQSKWAQQQQQSRAGSARNVASVAPERRRLGQLQAKNFNSFLLAQSPAGQQFEPGELASMLQVASHYQLFPQAQPTNQSAIHISHKPDSLSKHLRFQLKLPLRSLDSALTAPLFAKRRYNNNSLPLVVFSRASFFRFDEK